MEPDFVTKKGSFCFHCKLSQYEYHDNVLKLHCFPRKKRLAKDAKRPAHCAYYVAENREHALLAIAKKRRA